MYFKKITFFCINNGKNKQIFFCCKTAKKSHRLLKILSCVSVVQLNPTKAGCFVKNFAADKQESRY